MSGPARAHAVARPAGLPAELAALRRPAVMGVLNVTPDSFSDGGRYLQPDAAVQRALDLRSEGADIVDVGGEATRPGAERIPADVEAARVLPVIAGLAAAQVPVSIDTTRARIAEAAVAAGACLVNDVSGGLADPDMHRCVADLGVPYVAMHWRGPSRDMDAAATYSDVVADVMRELRERLHSAVAAGIDPEAVVLDPGLGFAKDAEHNWQLLDGLGELVAIGQPVLIGASRKRFLGAVLADEDGAARPVDERDDATTAITALATLDGVWGVRVHAVRASRDAVAVATAWRRGGSHG